MADEASAPAEAQPEITFNVKSSSDQKYVVTVPQSMTVLGLKQKLSASEYADVSADRQRLIYSGRVMKDPDTLATYKIKEGNTVHMVKSAANNQRPNPASPSSTSTAPRQDSQGATGVPQNLASGAGTDPLAGLTGARYAGFAQMPGAGMFGPDGGMGAPQGQDDMLRMLENPMFQQQMNEAMNNPHVIQMLQNSPMIRDQPLMREMLNNPEMRRLIMDPQFIRQSMQMSRLMGGGSGFGQSPSMPAPGVTDNTPQGNERSANTSEQANSGATSQQTPPPPNPFQGLFPMQGQQAQGQANPFAMLFGPGMNAMNPQMPNNTTTNSSTDATADQSQQQQQQQQQPNAAPNMFDIFRGGPQAQGQGEQQQNPIASMAQQMMQNPQLMQSMMQMMGGAGGMGAPQGEAGAGGANPFASLFGSPPQQQDSRPPEEQYADQLRSLNEMGFYDFDRNVRALRMAGGNVEGAIEVLLSGSV